MIEMVLYKVMMNDFFENGNDWSLKVPKWLNGREQDPTRLALFPSTLVHNLLYKAFNFKEVLD